MTAKSRRNEAAVLEAGWVFVDDTRNKREIVEVAGQRVRWRVPGKDKIRETRLDAWTHWARKFNARRTS